MFLMPLLPRLTNVAEKKIGTIRIQKKLFDPSNSPNSRLGFKANLEPQLFFGPKFVRT